MSYNGGIILTLKIIYVVILYFAGKDYPVRNEPVVYKPWKKCYPLEVTLSPQSMMSCEENISPHGSWLYVELVSYFCHCVTTTFMNEYVAFWVL